MMHICSGLVGPKSGNVEKVLFFYRFFEGVKAAKSILRKRTAEREEGGLGSKSGLKTRKKKKKGPLDMRWQA